MSFVKGACGADADEFGACNSRLTITEVRHHTVSSIHTTSFGKFITC